MNHLYRIALQTCLLWLLAGSAHALEIIVIVSAHSPTSTLRSDQVVDIFLGQNAFFPDGRDAIALDQNIGSAIRDDFYYRLAAKSPALLKAYWSKMIFTGRGQPPREVHNSVAVRKLVAENPGLIGYIDKAAWDSSVKSVLVLP